MIPIEDVIRILNLKPLTGEGGMWSQAFVSDETVTAGTFEGRDTDRPLYGSIYYLITPSSFSCMHKLSSDEIWYHHSGPAVKLLLIHPDGKSEIKLLGQNLLAGEMPQIRVPRGTWQGCIMNEDESSMNTDSSEHGSREDEHLTHTGDDEGHTHMGESTYTLMSTSMAPKYQDSEYIAGTFEELKEFVAEDEIELLKRLTAAPSYI